MFPKALVVLLFLALVSPYQSLKLLRPCAAKTITSTSSSAPTSPRSLLYEKRLDSILNFAEKATAQSALRNFKDNEVNVDKNSVDILSNILSNSYARKAAMASALIAITTLGFQSPAFASALESVTEKVSSSGFLQSFLLIFVSEIGDKTFFIAGLLAAKYSRFISFTGSIGALALMTIISTVIGQLFHAVPSSLTQGVPYDDYIAGHIMMDEY
jgi:hypothetical protein